MQNFMFSIVTAAYNAAKWLPQLYGCLREQTFPFDDIQWIIVNDGSKDNTAELLEKWQKMHPRNLVCPSRPNGGVAAARNDGIAHATGEWVTFIDADDLVSADYFRHVAEFLASDQFSGLAVSTYMLNLREKRRVVTDDHYLRYRFKGEIQTVDMLTQPEYIALYVNSAFVRGESLRKSAVRFSSAIRPSFEDAHFLACLQLDCRNFTMAFLRAPQYLYRRHDEGLAMGGWNSLAKFRNQVLGYLDLCRKYTKTLGHIPLFIQNMILSEGKLYIEHMQKDDIAYTFTSDELKDFLALIRTVFKFLDIKNLLTTPLPLLSVDDRLSLAAIFKGTEGETAFLQLCEVAPDKRSCLLKLYAANEKKCLLLHGPEGAHPPLREKTVRRRFRGLELCTEQYAWINLDSAGTDNADGLRLTVNGAPASVFAGGGLFDALRREELLDAFYLPQSALPEKVKSIMETSRGPEVAERYAGCWLFMDRPHKADDNAEHLYRWFTRNTSLRQRVYFILSRTSSDWHRLAKEGFNLLPYMGAQHLRALFHAEWLISSHADPAVYDPMGVRSAFGLCGYKFAFLDHGITKDDVSGWLNRVPMDLFVTATQREYDFVIGGNFKFTPREVALTGFPRHDALRRKRQEPSAGNILFCPTWRTHLKKSEAFSGEPTQEELAVYANSDYVKGWKALLNNRALLASTQKNKRRLLFLPHPEVSRFVACFGVGDDFSVFKYSDVHSIQDLLVSCDMLVTDYSSLVMDFAMLGRPLLYYQFAESPPFFQAHLTKPGYFSYARDGFGPVVATAEEAEQAITATAESGFKREPLYSERAEKFFTLWDGQNCRRVYEAIVTRSENGEIQSASPS
jgi:glycosyltransferase involved in cell wall biosynthesis/CDP-glycerol glycerophosphotransferase (TagB/SpsB family)